ncbi:MAG: aminotransferase class I/II-fold pyridoxal phosphate-dependent enzyme [Deltaproteobacteria bacterium]|nr:MAG: aminotransferase class I/II-fold pyridoxal phosphate-dependent enzyme [Deltaproteobacteria bacterium]
MNIVAQYGIRGEGTRGIVTSVEAAIRQGRLAAGAPLPTVRELARALRMSPTTVAAAYRTLRGRGLVHARGRRGTRVSPRPPLPIRPVAPAPSHLRDLSLGNPDPALLPSWQRALARLPRRPGLYGEPANRPELLALARRQLERDGLPRGELAVVGGALDGIERVLQAHLRPGDRVAVEDPGYVAVFDLVAALGLVAEPVGIDDSGPLPDDLGRALRCGAEAFVLTPRAQNPTGAAVDAARARELRAVLAKHPEVLVIEDDHAGPIAGAPPVSVCHGSERWAVVRSVSKSLGPDLRLAILTGDATTVARVEGRQSVGTGWVSHLLQDLVTALWGDAATDRQLQRAADAYAGRREALVRALAAHGLAAHGRSGLNVWVPVIEEAAIVSALAGAGWAVRAGERYRLRSGPAVRITVAALAPRESDRLAAALARSVRPERRRVSA